MLKYTIDGFSAIKTCLFPWPVLSVLMIFLVLIPLILWKIKLYKKDFESIDYEPVVDYSYFQPDGQTVNLKYTYTDDIYKNIKFRSD